LVLDGTERIVFSAALQRNQSFIMEESAEDAEWDAAAVMDRSLQI
jgi:hypothetical protein